MSILGNKRYRRGQKHLPSKDLNRGLEFEQQTRRGRTVNAPDQPYVFDYMQNSGEQSQLVIYPVLYITRSNIEEGEEETDDDTIEAKKASSDGTSPGGTEQFVVPKAVQPEE